MCTHLSKRGSTYYFRRVIPLDLRSTFNVGTEWVWSLKTKDREEGKRRAQAATVETNAKISHARNTLASGGNLVGQLLQEMQAVPEWEVDRADHDAKEQDEASERFHQRRYHRKRIEERMKLPTAALTEEEAAHRDIFSGERFKRVLVEDQLLIARAELLAAKVKPLLEVHVSDIVQPATVLNVPTMALDGALIDLWSVRRQNIWPRLWRRLVECGPRLGFDVRRRSCGVASADVRWSVA